MIDYDKIVWCDECEIAWECEKRKVNDDLCGCYEGKKVGDT